MTDTIRLTPTQCAAQFRLYADMNQDRSAQHTLRFCADFLDEFCPSEVESPRDDSITQELIK